MKVKTTFKVLMFIKGEKLADKRADQGFQVTVTHYRPFGEWAGIAAMNMTFLSFPDRDTSGEVAYLLFLVHGEANEFRVLSPEESIFVVHKREKVGFLTIRNAEAPKK